MISPTCERVTPRRIATGTDDTEPDPPIGRSFKYARVQSSRERKVTAGDLLLAFTAAVHRRPERWHSDGAPAWPEPMTLSDNDTAAERLVSVVRTAARWANPWRPPTPDGRPRGCLNPIGLFKAVIFLLMILLLPVFMLPLLFTRIATVGRTVAQHATTMRVIGGERARTSYGTLAAASDPDSLNAGLAAIARDDPGFKPATLTGWASAATALLRESLTSGDATPARTFMANGLFRSYQALLELRAQAGVSCAGSWRAVDAVAVLAVRTPLFDEVRVRVWCQGWCAERHEPTGLTLRDRPDGSTWAEDLTFGRSARATTPASGGLPARRCPSCGAPLALDADGACNYCQGIVTAGRHDWVLTEWRREPW
jgi:hypothetical protein